MRIQQIVINLLDNAIKYSDEPPIIKVDTFLKKNKIIVIIEDKGIGMDANAQKLIFQKFYRVQSGNIHDIKGHGLGLTYVKKIIDVHGGFISLKSKKGYGTTFEIAFPI